MNRHRAITAAMTLAFLLGIYLMPMPANANGHDGPPRTCEQLALHYVQHHAPTTVQHWRAVRDTCRVNRQHAHCTSSTLTVYAAIDCTWPPLLRADAKLVAHCESTAEAPAARARRAPQLGRWADNG